MHTALKVIAATALWVAASMECAATPAPVLVSGAYGFVDIDLPISEVTEASGIVKVIARGLADGVEVGFELDFPSKSAKQPDHRNQLPLGIVRVRTLGVPSDNFVALLAKQYHMPLLASAMVRVVDASVVGLEGDPADILRSPTKTKIFFYDSGPDDRYAEVFLNVDVQHRILQVYEKDEDYRRPLLLALTHGP